MLRWIYFWLYHVYLVFDCTSLGRWQLIEMRMIRKSRCGPRFLCKFALVWVWLVIDRKSSSYSSPNSVGTNMDVSPHISGNINVYQMLQANRRSRIQVPFSVVCAGTTCVCEFCTGYLIAWPRVRIELQPQGWSNVHFIDWFLVILHKIKWF